MILLINFLHNGERHSIKTHSLGKRCVLIFSSGLCFTREGQFNESTSRVPEGETMSLRQKIFSLSHECHRPWVTRMDFSPGFELNSQPKLFRCGEVFKDLGTSLCALNPTTREAGRREKCVKERRLYLW